MKDKMFSPFAGPKLKKFFRHYLETVIEPAKTIDYFYAFSGVADPDPNLIIFEK
jgi:hypothetical protein